MLKNNIGLDLKMKFKENQMTWADIAEKIGVSLPYTEDVGNSG